MVRRGNHVIDNPTLNRLWKEYCGGQRMEARNALVEFYRPFAFSVVRRVKMRVPHSVEIGDLEGAANLGLIQAIENYEPDRGVPPEGFFKHRIHGAILDELRRLDWLPRPMRNRINQRKQAVDQLRSELDRKPTDGEVADRLGVSMQEYLDNFGGKESPVMASSKAGSESEPGLDFMEDKRMEGPDEDVYRREMLAAISASLDAEGRTILFKKYFEGRSLKEIGEEMGLSQSRVSKIIGRLKERLKDRFEEQVN